jgi:hypothetical protein
VNRAARSAQNLLFNASILSSGGTAIIRTRMSKWRCVEVEDDGVACLQKSKRAAQAISRPKVQRYRPGLASVTLWSRVTMAVFTCAPQSAAATIV